MTIKYSNKYGSLDLDLIGDYISVHQTLGVPDSVMFDVEIAEQIALITGNRMIQICFRNPKFYVLVHDSPSTAALAKIKQLNFISNVNPAIEIATLNKFTML